MPSCIKRNEDHDDLYEILQTWVKEDPRMTLENLIEKAENENIPFGDGDATGEDVVDSLILKADVKTKPAVDKARQQMRDNKKEARLYDELVDLLNGASKRNDPSVTPEVTNEQQRLIDIIKELNQIVSRDESLTDEEYGELSGRLQEIQEAYYYAYDMGGTALAGGDVDFTTEINKALNLIRGERQARAAKRTAKKIKVKGVTGDADLINKRKATLTNKIAEAQAKLKRFAEGNFTPDDLLDAQVNVTPIESELVSLGAKLRRIERETHEVLQREQRKTLASEGIVKGIFGISMTGKIGQTMKLGWLMARDLGWEVPRAMQFMMDASAFFVQLEPVVVRAISSPIINSVRKYIFRETDLDVWSEVKLLGKAIQIGTVNVIVENFKEVRRKGLRAGTVPGAYASEQFQKLIDNELYGEFISYGLKISESRNLTDTEEYFGTSLINRIPLAGVVKDFSEDIMVTTLNIYRWEMMKKFKEANPNLDKEQYRQVANFINQITGTYRSKSAKVENILNGASVVFSAPRLMAARFTTAKDLLFAAPKLISKVDLGEVAKGNWEKGIAWKNESDRYRMRSVVGLGASYAAMAVFLSMVSAALDFMDWEDDPREADFLRLRLGNAAVDATGGLGAIYRVFASALMHIATGIDNPALNAVWGEPSYLAKERFRIQKAQGSQKTLREAAERTFIRYKLHPSIQSILAVASGTNLFGEPYDGYAELRAMFGISDKEDMGHWTLKSLEAVLGAGIPIFLNTTLESFEVEDVALSTEGQIISTGLRDFLAFLGVNSFTYAEQDRNIIFVDYWNAIEYKPQLGNFYPEELKAKRTGTHEKRFYQRKYKEMAGRALAELVISYDIDPERLPAERLKREWKREVKRVQREFMDIYGDSIKKLEDSEATKRKGKKRRSTGI